MKRNITLRLDEALLREARVVAASENTSISQLLTRLLEERIRSQRAYERAQRRALRRLREARPLGWQPPETRDELHER